MFERFTQSFRGAVENVRYEAVRRGDRRIGTDHLLLALRQDESLSRVVGVDNETARAAADRLDRAAASGSTWTRCHPLFSPVSASACRSLRAPKQCSRNLFPTLQPRTREALPRDT
ncbi:hypothetical protein E5720_08000 [Rhodococcus sp. PAMC28707]|nr:hypothetical protein E5769_06015 [Rhodococcus sp. PAMC28705]QCB58460.1 hypothetical protein E5720_08000 [Rhodococcus sp. PAMC28707]